MQVIGSGWKWILLGCGLFLISFGGLGILVILYTFILLAGGIVIAWSYGKQQSRTLLDREDFPSCSIKTGVQKVRSHMESDTKFKNFDKRMTGASVIDDALKEVLEYTVRDYIKTWYRQISDHDGFLVDIWQCVQKVVITFSNRSKEVDWMPYFTQRLVDDFASHIRLYRRAVVKKNHMSKEDAETAQIEDLFFDLEVDMEDNMCRDLVCMSPEAERQYLQDLSEVLLFLLLPKEDFHNKPFRYLIREVLVNGVFIPTVDLLSDPDYFNQYMAWLCKETSFSKETFLSVIRSTDCEDELDAVREIVEASIAKWRSRDTGGSDDTVIKQNLNSLVFVRDTCQMRKKRLEEGVPDTDQPSDEPEYLKYQNLYVLTLDDIINNNIALQSFIEFMTSKGGQQYLFFYLNVEGFRTAAEQQINEAQKIKQDTKIPEPDLESLRRAATIIYDQYLSDKATARIKVESDIAKRTFQNIKSKMLSADVFDVVQARVYQILHNQYYEEFLQSSTYVRLLGELGLLPDSKSEDGDTLSIDDDVSARAGSEGSVEDLVDSQDDSSADTVSLDSMSSVSSAGSPGDVFLSAHISYAGIVKETDKSAKTYAVFAITVKRKLPETDDEEGWDVYRRYSDFHDLHMIITERYPDIVGPSLPGKTVVRHTNKEFLEKRRRALDAYLRSLLKLEVWQKFPGLEELVSQFLAPGLWEKHKSELARKMDTIVNPLKTSVKNVSHAVKSMPDGVTKLSDGLGKVFKGSGSDLSKNDFFNSGKVGASLDPEVEENIPLRIMLLLLDEVFDLQHKNQWLRRRIVAILRQLIKATFGDKINRKIVEHVDWLTSAEQMAEYVKNFRNSFWPMGVLAEPRPPREKNTIMRTRVLCKAKMLGSVPDEMRTLMGADTVKMGVVRIFDMFQYKSLNKRLVYVFLEGVIHTVFPENKFEGLFRKLHSRSSRAKAKETNDRSKDATLHKRQSRR